MVDYNEEWMNFTWNFFTLTHFVEQLHVVEQMFGIFLFDDGLTHLQPLLFVLFQLFAARLFSYFFFVFCWLIIKIKDYFEDSKFLYFLFFLLAWSVGFMNLPALVLLMERRPIFSFKISLFYRCVLVCSFFLFCSSSPLKI